MTSCYNSPQSLNNRLKGRKLQYEDTKYLGVSYSDKQSTDNYTNNGYPPVARIMWNKGQGTQKQTKDKIR
jgi:hypothetical protein